MEPPLVETERGLTLEKRESRSGIAERPLASKCSISGGKVSFWAREVSVAVGVAVGE